MGLKKSKLIGFRVTPTKARRLELEARENKKTIQDFIEEAVDFRCAIPEKFWSALEKVADGYQLPVATVVAHIVIKQAALDSAWMQTMGNQPPGVNREFKFDPTGKGLITGDQLANILVDEYKDIFKTVKKKFVKAEDLEKKGKKIPKTMDYLLSPTEMHAAMSQI